MSWLKEKKQYRPVHEKKFRNCHFCDTNTMPDFKDVDGLISFVDTHGEITGSRVNGNCRKHQKRVELAIKHAREVAFEQLPHVPSPEYHLRGR